jgi:hypothetical protein
MTVNLSNNYEYIGDNGSGSFTQPASPVYTNQVNIDLEIAASTTGSGSYTLSGGILSASQWEDGGMYGTGLFTQTGGSNILTGSGLCVGTTPAGYGTYNLQVGSISAANNEYIGYGGTGTFS